jgi:hypothetical protein
MVETGGQRPTLGFEWFWFVRRTRPTAAFSRQATLNNLKKTAVLKNTRLRFQCSFSFDEFLIVGDSMDIAKYPSAIPIAVAACGLVWCGLVNEHVPDAYLVCHSAQFHSSRADEAFRMKSFTLVKSKSTAPAISRHGIQRSRRRLASTCSRTPFRKSQGNATLTFSGR